MAEAKVKTEAKTVPILVALTNIRYNGKSYKAGDVLDKVDEKAAGQLLELKAAKQDVKHVEVPVKGGETE